MAIILAIVLGLLALAFVLYPLYRRPSVTAEQPGHTAVPSSPSESEQNARTALQEVELDYQLGNIAQQDYQSLRERYMRRALVALKSRYEREQEIDQEIEEQLRKLKEQGEDSAH